MFTNFKTVWHKGGATRAAKGVFTALCCINRHLWIQNAALTCSGLCELEMVLSYCISPICPWVLIATCGSKQYGFHLVHHPEKSTCLCRDLKPGLPDHNLNLMTKTARLLKKKVYISRLSSFILTKVFITSLLCWRLIILIISKVKWERKLCQNLWSKLTT